MCMINGMEIRTLEKDGELWFSLQDVADAVGYSTVGVSKMAHRIRKINPELLKQAGFVTGGSGIKNTNTKHRGISFCSPLMKKHIPISGGVNMTNREGLIICSARSAGAPGHCSKVREWQVFLSELDKYIESAGYKVNHSFSKVQPELPKIDAKATAGISSANAWTLHNTITSWEAAIDSFRSIISENEALQRERDILKQEVQRLNSELEKLNKELEQLHHAYTSVNEDNSRLQGILNRIQQTVKDVA
ncbi:MAG: hypothetical protein SOV61_00230 [Lachnospiraceae bacterium]|nr:hypothetical protein [Lachnospiraceae bacterium]